MACPECAGTTSTQASTCPHCGLPVSRYRPPSAARSAVAVFLSPVTLIACVAALVFSAPLWGVLPVWLLLTAWMQYALHLQRRAWRSRLLPRPTT